MLYNVFHALISLNVSFICEHVARYINTKIFFVQHTLVNIKVVVEFFLVAYLYKNVVQRLGANIFIWGTLATNSGTKRKQNGVLGERGNLKK